MIVADLTWRAVVEACSRKRQWGKNGDSGTAYSINHCSSGTSTSGPVGAPLLQDALRRFAAAAGTVAARLLVTHPIDDAAARFYARHGWTALTAGDRPTRYVLLEQVRPALR